MTKVKILSVDMAAENASLLLFDDYPDYFEAIVSNNAAFVDSFLSNQKVAERIRLVSTAFDLESANCPFLRKEISAGDIAIVLPLHIAVTNHSLDVARVLVKHGANVQQVDRDGNNVLHACVTSAFYAPETEGATCDVLRTFNETLDTSILLQMLKTENKEKFRPVEYAAQQETLQLLQYFIRCVDDYFITRTSNHGMTQYCWYDVTEYENERHFRSPIVQLTCLSRSKAKVVLDSFLKCPFFGVWIKAKFKINLIPIIIWFILRATFLLTYFAADRNDILMRQGEKELGDNFTLCFGDAVPMSTGQYYTLLTFMFLFALASITYDVIDVTHMIVRRTYVTMRNLKGWKDTTVKLQFYRVCTALVSIAVLISGGMVARLQNTDDISDSAWLVISLTRVIVPLCSCWSLMYFLQMLPYLGKSIVAIQGMLVDMANFMVIWVLIILPFIHTFQVYISYNNDGCSEDFSDFWSTFYSLFRMMLNMVDLTQLNVRFMFVLEIMHMIYVFMVAIILINFLIAIMSASASRIEEEELVIEWLNSLSVAVAIQERFGQWLLKPYYRYMSKRVFATDQNGRLFIVTHRNRSEELKNKGHVTTTKFA